MKKKRFSRKAAERQGEERLTEGDAKGVSPRILTELACMEESNGMIG